MQIPFRTWLTYSCIYGRRIHPQTLNAKLRRFSRVDLITTICKINNLLYGQRWGSTAARIDIDELLITSFIAPETRRMRGFVSGKANGDVVFHRQQILTLLRLSILHGSDSASGFIGPGGPEGFALGECCLIVNDSFESAQSAAAISSGDNAKARRHLGLQMAPSVELQNPVRMDRAIARSDIIYSDILHSPKMRQKITLPLGGFDLESEFLKITGLSIGDYSTFVYLLLAMRLHYPAFMEHRDPEINQRHEEVFKRIAMKSFGMAPPADPIRL